MECSQYQSHRATRPNLPAASKDETRTRLPLTAAIVKVPRDVTVDGFSSPTGPGRPYGLLLGSVGCGGSPHIAGRDSRQRAAQGICKHCIRNPKTPDDISPLSDPTSAWHCVGAGLAEVGPCPFRMITIDWLKLCDSNPARLSTRVNGVKSNVIQPTRSLELLLLCRHRQSSRSLSMAPARLCARSKSAPTRLL